MGPEDTFKMVAVLRKQGRADEALTLLRALLRRVQLNAEAVDRAGRLIRKEMGRADTIHPGLRVFLLGQCTTSWLANALVAIAWGRGTALEVTEGEYDNVLQELMAPKRLAAGTDVVVLLPW